jgi:epoxyqueuosine reductase
MDIKKITEKIKQICPHDLYEIGYADLTGLLSPEYSKYKYGLSIARKLDDAVIDEITDGPTILYHDLYHKINNELSKKALEITKLLESNNIKALPIKPTLKDSKLNDTYQKELRYHFSHKMTATQSGMGWIGKTDLLITKRFGPRVRLASILMTSCILDAGKPINESQCGDCNICVENCPVQAATGKSWTIKIDRNEFYDPFKCREFCKQITVERIKKDISICGICISVCPKGKK